MIKLLCIDIDGTLLDSQKELPEENVKAVHYAMEKGVAVALASGRSVSGMRPVMKELGTGDRAVCLNGSLIYYDKVIHQAVMEEALVDRVIRLAEQYGSQIFLSAAERNYTNGEVSPKLKALIEKGSLRSDYHYCADFEELKAEARLHAGEILKIAVKELDEENFDLLKADLVDSGLFHVAKSDTYFVDINPKGINKGEGVRILAAYLGIPMEQVMCIGDNENDREMVAVAGLGVAMGNAAELVRMAADYVTADNDHHGVAEAIYRFI